MSFRKQFESVLNKLNRADSFRLRKIVGITVRGKTQNLTKALIKREVTNLKNLYSANVELEEYKKAINKSVNEKRQWHVKRGKGWGVDAKKKSFREWFENHCNYQNYVYIFWKAKKCIYVGQSTQGKTRPTSHFEKYWFSSVIRIDLMNVSQKSEIGKLECLTIHRYNPQKNKYRPANKKWAKKCPIHAIYLQIENEIRRMYPMKRSRKV